MQRMIGIELIMSKGKIKNSIQKLNHNSPHFHPSLAMGPSQSLQTISNFDSYHTVIERHSKSFLFGPQLEIYKNKFNPKQQFAKHVLKFDNSKAMNHFVQEIRTLINTKANHVPFNILYPMNVFQKEQNSILNNIKTSCSEKTNEVIVIFKWLGKSLHDLVLQKKEPMNEKLIWFILNQISKSLEILQEKNHASHYLMPQNIWYNQNDNWFLYDGHYVLGYDYLDDFYKKKVKQEEIVSEDFKKKVLSNSIITNYEALQQDIYCLGYCLIFMMTAIHPKQLPLKQSQRETCVNDLLQSITETLSDTLHTETERLKLLENNIKQPKFSSELITFVKNLIKADPKRRYSIRHIRSYLKTKQQEIFMNQQQQWSRTTGEPGQFLLSQMKSTAYKLKRTNTAKSPDRQYRKAYTEQSQKFNDKYTPSMKTLKKQFISQKVILMNNDNFSKYPISLTENSAVFNSRIIEGQVTPIRKIQDTRTKRFQQYKTTSNTTFRADQPLPNTNQNQGNQVKHNSVHQLHPSFVSPQKFSSSSINPRSTMESFPYIAPSQHFNSLHVETSNHNGFKSPPHQAYQSPIKVKVNFFSPQKKYF